MKNLKPFSIACLFCLYSFAACVQKPKKIVSDRVFPDGTYTQSIQLNVKPPKQQEKQIPFTTLSQVKNGHFKILGLTPFGTRGFEASGNLDSVDSVHVTFHMEVPKFMTNEFIKKTLFQMQSMAKLKRSELSKKSDREIYTSKDYQLEIFSWNEKGVPKEIKVKSRNWSAFVTTSQYTAFQ